MDKLLQLDKSVSAEHIAEQHARFLSIIEKLWKEEDPPRHDALMRMYTDFEDRLLTAPASSKIHFHNAYPGGYLDHILHVIDTARGVVALYKKVGGAIDFTMSELIFAAMHHDLGKLGDDTGPYYLPEYDQYWHRKGARYRYNDALQTMPMHNRTLYVLNLYGVKYTANELLGMKMADGLFDEGNKSMFLGNDVYPHKTSIGYVVHWADWMAAMAEKDEMRKIYEAL